MSKFKKNSGTTDIPGANASTEFIQTRRPRNIVTPSGRGARGYFPSRKAPKPLKFESLVEQDVLRVLEISTLTESLVTQPFVMNLQVDGEMLRYTPDVEITTCEGRVLLETKDDSVFTSQRSLERLRRVISGMRSTSHAFVVILSSDVRQSGLQHELEVLLRERPSPGRYRHDVDPNRWDPLEQMEPSKELAIRWSEAKRTCDELLRRVMGRDPDELIINGA